jgi:hypothetical protein
VAGGHPDNDQSDRAVYDVLLRSFALGELGGQTLDNLNAARDALDAAVASNDFIAQRRALLEEAAIALVLLKYMPHLIPTP